MEPPHNVNKFLATIGDDFIVYLLQIVEGLADDDTGDPYHYPVIRVLVRLDDELDPDVVLTMNSWF